MQRAELVAAIAAATDAGEAGQRERFCPRAGSEAHGGAAGGITAGQVHRVGEFVQVAVDPAVVAVSEPTVGQWVPHGPIPHRVAGADDGDPVTPQLVREAQNTRSVRVLHAHGAAADDDLVHPTGAEVRGDRGVEVSVDVGGDGGVAAGSRAAASPGTNEVDSLQRGQGVLGTGLMASTVGAARATSGIGGHGILSTAGTPDLFSCTVTVTVTMNVNGRQGCGVVDGAALGHDVPAQGRVILRMT